MCNDPGVARQCSEVCNSTTRIPASPTISWWRSGAGNISEPARGPVTPVISLGLPKTGTSTIHQFFECTNVSSQHYLCGDGEICALCVFDNLRSGKLPPFQGCGDYVSWTQFDMYQPLQQVAGGTADARVFETVAPDKDRPTCFRPQYDSLEAISLHYPQAIFIVHRRPPTQWLESIKRYGVPTVATALRLCFGLSDDEALLDFYEEHYTRIRSFLSQHPQHTYVDIEIGSSDARAIMSAVFDARPGCWGHANKLADWQQTNCQQKNCHEVWSETFRPAY